VLELGAREVFDLMLGSQLTVAASDIKEALEITAMVGLAGQLCGVSMRCGVQAAALMTSKMLGEDPNRDKKEIWDALGEVCNMVAGNFENKIPGLSDGCMLSVPTVIVGHNYSLHPLKHCKTCKVSLLFENLPLTVCLEVQG
jgi:chemotaxis protein CheX